MTDFKYFLSGFIAGVASSAAIVIIGITLFGTAMFCILIFMIGAVWFMSDFFQKELKELKALKDRKKVIYMVRYKESPEEEPVKEVSKECDKECDKECGSDTACESCPCESDNEDVKEDEDKEINAEEISTDVN